MNGDILDMLGQQSPAGKTMQRTPAGDPLTAALGAPPVKSGSFFPAAQTPSYNRPQQSKFKFGPGSFTQMLLADARSDLSNEIEGTFYGGGHAPIPSPTPTPSLPWWNFWGGSTPSPTPPPHSQLTSGAMV